MNFNHWSEHQQLRNIGFIAINASNPDDIKKQFNDNLFSQRKTGQWDINKEVLEAGIVGKSVVLFYSLPGMVSTLYFGKIKVAVVTSQTNHNPPRERYTLEVFEPWLEVGTAAVSFSRFFEGVTMRASPTAVWVEAGREITDHTESETEHSNSYCEAWLGEGWRRVLVAEARMYNKLLVRCIECRGKVVLMKAGPNNTPRAHAEHRPGHPGCSLGHYFNGVRSPHPEPVEDPVDGSRDPFADQVINEDDESAFPEGKESYRLHKARERDPKIIFKAKAKRLRTTNKLECDVCQTDFHIVYGDLGRGFIEAHHKIPVSKLDGNTPTRIDDLALVCSNCHRMLHRKGGMSVEKLRELIFAARMQD